MIGILGIVVALGLLMYLAFRGISVIILAPAMALLAVLIDGSLAILGSYTQIFMQNTGDFIILFFPLFILGAIFGRKLGSSRNVGRATAAVRGAQRAARERGDIGRAEENVKALQSELVALEKDFQQELEAVRVQVDDSEIPCEELLVRPRKTDVGVEGLALVWMPWWQGADGAQAPAVRFD